MNDSGVGEQTVRDFLKGREWPAPLQCTLGLAFFRAINTLPDNEADGFLAYAISRGG